MVDGFSRGDVMIFVTLGTQDKSFHRLLDEIQSMIDDGTIHEKVVVQAGQTKYTSENMEIFDFVNMDDFAMYVKECTVLITHAGVGSIINGLDNHKKVIAVARLAKYVEHENDHQVQIVEEFASLGHILGCVEVNELRGMYEKLNSFVPTKYRSNNEMFCGLIERLIEEGNR